VDWPAFVRKYVWDEQKTPYLVRASGLTPAQARHELFAYGFLLGTGAGLVVALWAGGTPGALGLPLVGPYAASVAVAAIALGATRHPAAAMYCATAPVVLGVGALAVDIRPGIGTGETLLLVLFAGLWFRYALRSVTAARRARAAD
jgi:hypothetical protein